MRYEVRYSKRKTVGIKIESGAVVVKAPVGIGAAELDRIVNRHAEWIENAKLREASKRDRFSSLTDEDIKRLRIEARKYFLEKCAYYAGKMQLSYNRISINSAKTRFGSCSSKKNINFSYRLMLYPEAAREYVVVHELAHTKEMNHSKKFYDIIEKYLPDYKERRKLLKQ